LIFYLQWAGHQSVWYFYQKKRFSRVDGTLFMAETYANDEDSFGSQNLQSWSWIWICCSRPIHQESFSQGLCSAHHMIGRVHGLYKAPCSEPIGGSVLMWNIGGEIKILLNLWSRYFLKWLRPSNSLLHFFTMQSTWRHQDSSVSN